MNHSGAQRGFTLFTALVAFILIVLAMLLVQSMISTERSVSDVISDVSSQEEMQAIADLSRADALQVFNYNVRYSIEQYSAKDTEPKDGKSDNPYYISAAESGDWGNMQKEFVKNRFGVKAKGDVAAGSSPAQFAPLVARNLISLLQKVPDARGYRIDLEHPEEAQMTQIMQSTFQSQSDNSDFFEVIKCPEGKYRGCVGTFYVTLDLSKEAMNDATYEKFPLVQVEEIQTGKVIKEAILPRGKFRLYIPVRLFKALAAAREVSHSNGSGIFDDEIAQTIAAKKSKSEMDAALRERVELLVGSGGRDLKTPDDGFVLSGYDVDTHPEKIENDPLTPDDDQFKLVSYEVWLYFKEGNDKYMVSRSADNVYGVHLSRFPHLS